LYLITSLMSDKIHNGFAVSTSRNSSEVHAFNSSETSTNDEQKLFHISNSSQSSLPGSENTSRLRSILTTETDSIGSAGSIILGKKMSSVGSKASSLYNTSIDMDDEILVGDERELHNSCRSGNIVSVERLIKSGIDINCRNKHDRTPLHWAAGNGHLEIIKLLLDEGANIDACDKFGMDALLWSAWFGHKHC